MKTEHMTGAELRTLREACGLGVDDLGALVDVQGRSVRHWESGRAGVPQDVAECVHALDQRLNQAAAQALDTVRHLLDQARQRDATQDTKHNTPGSADTLAELVLLRYASREDLRRFRPDFAGYPSGVHGAMLARVRAGLLVMGVRVRVVYMQPDDYDAWRAAQQLPDTEATRAQWAAHQVQAQSMPHRPDPSRHTSD